MNRLWSLLAVALLACIANAAPPESKPYQPPKDYKDFDLDVLHIKWFEPLKDEKTGFMVGGKNPTALIRKLTEISGRPIADLEADMRPGAETEVGSGAGFLGRDEKLLDVLAADNEMVLGDLKLTHQQLARHLTVLGNIADWQSRTGGQFGKELPAFTYHGRRLRMEIVYFKGFQLSPFKDDTSTSTDATIHNLDNGKKLWYSRLVPHMIERYGFYEGKGTRYRVDPREIVEALDFLKPAPNK